jgi:hypothetical protein
VTDVVATLAEKAGSGLMPPVGVMRIALPKNENQRLQKFVFQ